MFVNINQEMLYKILKKSIKPNCDFISEEYILEISQEKNLEISYDEACEIANMINTEIDFINDESRKYNKNSKIL